jgi:hypothetical protein
LLLNKQRLNSRNRCQAASIIIEDLNYKKNFTPSNLYNQLLFSGNEKLSHLQLSLSKV